MYTAVEDPAACKVSWTVGWEGEDVFAWVNQNWDFSLYPNMMHDTAARVPSYV